MLGDEPNSFGFELRVNVRRGWAMMDLQRGFYHLNWLSTIRGEVQVRRAKEADAYCLIEQIVKLRMKQDKVKDEAKRAKRKKNPPHRGRRDGNRNH